MIDPQVDRGFGTGAMLHKIYPPLLVLLACAKSILGL